jgi:hypothetical protein
MSLLLLFNPVVVANFVKPRESPWTGLEADIMLTTRYISTPLIVKRIFSYGLTYYWEVLNHSEAPLLHVYSEICSLL